jgi:hypothetical protein
LEGRAGIRNNRDVVERSQPRHGERVAARVVGLVCRAVACKLMLYDVPLSLVDDMNPFSELAALAIPVP